MGHKDENLQSGDEKPMLELLKMVSECREATEYQDESLQGETKSRCLGTVEDGQPKLKKSKEKQRSKKKTHIA